MGTRFMCTKESEIHQNIKDIMVKSTETDTIHSSSCSLIILPSCLFRKLMTYISLLFSSLPNPGQHGESVQEQGREGRFVFRLLLLCSNLGRRDETQLTRADSLSFSFSFSLSSSSVVALERRPGGAKFEDLRELVAGSFSHLPLVLLDASRLLGLISSSFLPLLLSIPISPLPGARGRRTYPHFSKASSFARTIRRLTPFFFLLPFLFSRLHHRRSRRWNLVSWNLDRSHQGYPFVRGTHQSDGERDGGAH